MDRIPNKIILTGMLAAVLYRTVYGTYFVAVSEREILIYLGKELGGLFLRTGIVFMLFYPLYKLGTFGAGDVKLYCMAAMFLGERDCTAFLLSSLFLAAMASFIKLFWQGNAKERIQYLCSYTIDVLRTGRFGMYFDNPKVKKEASLHMAAPMLAGLLCHILGIF